MRAIGTDVSHWNSPVNWNTMYSKGIRFAFIKATQGHGDYKDPDHFTNSANAKAAGVLTAPYHFYIEGDSPFGQAEFFNDNSDPGLLPPVLDVEKPPWFQLLTMMRAGEIPKEKRTKAVMQWLAGNANAANVKATVQTIEGLFGVKPLIYSNLDSWKNWVVGDKSWASAYPLWIAGYWYTYFKDWMLVYLNDKNPVLPAPFLMWEFWQFTAYAPGKEYGAASASLDLNFYNGDEAALVAEYGTLPPPDPIGDEIMYYADVVYLAPGTTYRNIRSKPHSSGAQIGLDVGDVVLTDKNMPVYEVITNNEGEWYHLKKGELVGWVLGKAAGIVYLKLSDPVPTLKLQTVMPANLRYYNTLNGAGKPILKLPPVGSRPQFSEGAQIIADPDTVDCDGSIDAYRVLNGHMAYPVTYTPPAGYTGWFVLESEVIPL